MNLLLIADNGDNLIYNLQELGTEKTRGNLTIVTEDIVVDTITAIATFLTNSAIQGKYIQDVAQDGIKGIKEWGLVIAKLPAIIAILLQFYNNVIKDIDDFGQALTNITPEQIEKSKQVFVAAFDLPNDKAEYLVEKIVASLLEFLPIIKAFK